jgi:hypothetical protein
MIRKITTAFRIYHNFMYAQQKRLYVRLLFRQIVVGFSF